ncbi:MAG: alpha/beta hydrolase [Anaerolineaceae bacterium]|nr:alpha/beta hydrolase [Anaerolineaceae bacterium]
MEISKKLFGTLLFLSLLLCACAREPEPIIPKPTFAPEKLGSAETDIVYCQIDGNPLHLNLYYPNQADTSWPVVIYVHGGGWIGGTHQFPPLIDELRDANIVLASVEYRLSPEVKFPSHIEDVKCAVRFLRAHADEYNLDPDHFGAIGDSAGGQLVSLLGLTTDQDFNSQGQWQNETSAVQAVVNFYGPADMRGFPCYDAEWSALVFGEDIRCGTDDPLLTQASPITYVHWNAPPFLHFHGDRDPIVSLGGTIAFDEALRQTGVSSELVIVKGAGHGFGPQNDPPIDQIFTRVTDFFIDQLDAIR